MDDFWVVASVFLVLVVDGMVIMSLHRRVDTVEKELAEVKERSKWT